MSAEATLPLEHFIQAVQSQLDNAQTAMAFKARNLNLPLTFAIKDIRLDLRAHVEFARSEIRIRPAGAADKAFKRMKLRTQSTGKTTALALGGALGRAYPRGSLDPLRVAP